MNRLCPAEARLKEGANALDLGPIRWEYFPCRGLEAPCQRAERSIRVSGADVKHLTSD